ncbi:unnamed protein product [Pieris macdunnoughi]|uniref:Nucleolar protein 9 n=1 Tax=Pieris macdunnoughi TaxID=345717 RepID=A0A821SSG5_9NEOP|nr:unnamed protein product [Pieris macdunnoughi]
MGEEAQHSNENKKRQRKKRKNFISNAKKYAKKGQLGRGTQIPEELYQYFVGILDVIKEGIQDPDEREALVRNVLERTKGEEINVVGNQLGCRLVELLLPYSSSEDLERFIEILSPELRKLSADNFSSHVIETLLRVSCARATEHLQETDEPPVKKSKKDEKYSEEHIKACHEFTLKICKYALNNLEDFVWDQYANHILRSALKCLSGITLLPGEKPKVNLFKETVQDKKGIPPHLTNMTYKVVPDEFKEIVTDFANRLSSWPQFKDMAYENLTSGLLQEKDGEDKPLQGSNLPPVFESEPAVRLLEAALFVVKKKTYTQIYAKCFINRLGQLAAMPMLNFTVQRLIDNCQIKEEFEPMFDELSSKFDTLLACGNTGVLVALAKACLRIKARQAQFIQTLEKSLNCMEDNQKHFALQCLRLVPLGGNVEISTQGFFINIHGSVILQTVLDFQRPTKAVQSILELQPESLLYIFSEAKGSHVADAFCKGQFVGVKARDKLIWKLKGCYQTLAMSQHGSRAFEKIYESASNEQKVKIMAELSEKSNLLNSTNFGRLIATKLDVAGFKLSQNKWEQSNLKKSDNKAD